MAVFRSTYCYRIESQPFHAARACSLYHPIIPTLVSASIWPFEFHALCYRSNDLYRTELRNIVHRPSSFRHFCEPTQQSLLLKDLNELFLFKSMPRRRSLPVPVYYSGNLYIIQYANHNQAMLRLLHVHRSWDYLILG